MVRRGTRVAERPRERVEESEAFGWVEQEKKEGKRATREVVPSQQSTQKAVELPSPRVTTEIAQKLLRPATIFS